MDFGIEHSAFHIYLFITMCLLDNAQHEDPPSPNLGQVQIPEQLYKRRDPLAIPEVLILVFERLDNHSLLKCLSVSRTWYSIVLPSVWSTFEVNLDSHKCPPINVLQKHLALVRKLSVSDDRVRSMADMDEELFYSNLSTLTINPSQQSTSAPSTFIRRHRNTLTSLSLSVTMYDELLDAIVGCPHLTELSLINPRLSTVYHWKTMFSCLWPRLKVMTIKGHWALNNTPDQHPCNPNDYPALISSPLTGLPTVSKIKELVFHTYETNRYVTQSQLLLIQQCPDLARLYWDNTRYSSIESPAYQIAQMMASEHRWERLEALVFRGQTVSTEDFKLLVEGMTRITELSWRGCTFEMDHWNILKELAPRHLTTLRILDLRVNYFQYGGRIVQDILCLMPNLSIFRSEACFKDTDLDDRPWVCRGLKELTLVPSFMKPKLQSVMFSRIAELTKLEYFACGFPYNRLEGGQSPRLTLQHALGVLSSLRKLRTFAFHTAFSQDHWRKPEALWVLKHWPDLKRVVGVEKNDHATYLLRHVCFDSWVTEYRIENKNL